MCIRSYRHPTLFYLLSALLPWTCWLFAGYISHLAPINKTLNMVIAALAFLGLISPNIVALMLILPEQEVRRDMLGRFFNFRNTKVRYWLVACLLMLASILLAQAVSLLFGYSATQFKLADSFSFSSAVFPVWLLLIVAPFLEECAWHSYGTDCLRARFSLFTSSMIFAFYWGVWHLPLAAIQGYYHSNLLESGLIYSLNFFVSIFPFVLIMNWLYYKSNRGILIIIVFHISAGYFNEIFQSHPMSKVMQTVLLIFLSFCLVLKEWRFFFAPLEDVVNADNSDTHITETLKGPKS